jgi:uncharacterized Tic20 family protein
MSAEVTTTAAAVTPTTNTTPATTSAVWAVTQPTPGSLPATYVETDPAQCGDAKIGHLLGIFGILGTGIWYLVKKNDNKPFVMDQAKEAFNFQVLVFCAAIALMILGIIVTMVVGVLGMIFSLANMALWVGALVLSITNALKAGKGQVARYPARLSVLK